MKKPKMPKFPEKPKLVKQFSKRPPSIKREVWAPFMEIFSSRVARDRWPM